MKKIDFTHFAVDGIEGKPEHVDLHRELGHMLYYQGEDETASMAGKKIYSSEGEIEITDEEAERVKAMVPRIYSSWLIRNTLLTKLEG